MPTPKQQRRRALELLEASIDGCTEAIMLAYGFKTELLDERISARVEEIVGRAADRAEVSLERVLRELKAIAFSDISKAVTWGPSVQVREEEEDGHRVKVIVNAVLLVPSDKLDEDTAAAISSVSQSSAGAVRIKMHNKLAALVALGKYLGMFDQRPQNSNVIYAISDEPMTAEEWKKQFVKPGGDACSSQTSGRGGPRRVRSRSRCRFLLAATRTLKSGRLTTRRHAINVLTFQARPAFRPRMRASLVARL
jgi:phage terminase small subunit